MKKGGEIRRFGTRLFIRRGKGNQDKRPKLRNEIVLNWCMPNKVYINSGVFVHKC